MIKGYDRLLEQFEGIKNLDWVTAEKKGLQVIADEAVILVSVDTGDLQSTIRVEVDGEVVQLTAGGGDVDYPWFVELGTSKMSAQPYIRPAIDSKERESVKIIANDLESQMRRKIA